MKLKSENKQSENKESESKEKEKENNDNKKENDEENKEENEEENENDSKKENENTETENTENEKEIEKGKENENEIINEKNENNEKKIIKEENNDNDEIFILLCILLSKNKLNETILSFIDTILKTIENSEIIDKTLKNNIIKECQEIKTILEENFKNIIKEQIEKCLNNISQNDNIDIYINDYYLVL